MKTPRAGALVLMVALAMASLAVAVLWPATRATTSHDDHYLLARAASPRLPERLSVYTLECPGPLCNSPWWRGAEYTRRFVRVLPSALLSAEVAVLGSQPGPLHLTALALHLVNGLLLFTLLRRRFGPAGSLAGTAVFVLHPAAFEMVAWIANRAALVGATTALLSAHALLDLLDRRSAGPSEAGPLARLLLFALLAMTSYEALVALPLLLAAAVGSGLEGHALAGPPRPPGPGGSATLMMALLGLLPLYAALRALLGASDLARPPHLLVSPMLAELSGYLARTAGLFPSGDDPAWPATRLGIGAGLGVPLLVVALLLVLAARRRVLGPVLLGLAAFALFLVPPLVVRGLVGVLNNPSLRQLYLPLLGLSLVVAALLSGPEERRSGARSEVLVLVALWPLLLALQTPVQGQGWLERRDGRPIAAGLEALLAGPAGAGITRVAWIGHPRRFHATLLATPRLDVRLAPPARGPGGPPALCARGERELEVSSGSGFAAGPEPGSRLAQVARTPMREGMRRRFPGGEVVLAVAADGTASRLRYLLDAPVARHRFVQLEGTRLIALPVSACPPPD